MNPMKTRSAAMNPGPAEKWGQAATDREGGALGKVGCMLCPTVPPGRLKKTRISVDNACPPVSDAPRLVRAVKRPLHRIVRIRRDPVIAPQPAHHLPEDRLQHLLAVPLDAPGVVHVVALLRQRLLHPYILIEPVAILIVFSVRCKSAIVVPPVHQEYPQRFPLTSANDIRILVASANVRKAPHVA